MKEIWRTFKKEVLKQNKDFGQKLNNGVELKEIKKLEDLISKKLPQDFIDLYTENDGQDESTSGIFNCEEFLSIERLISEWKIWKELHEGGDFEDFESEPNSNSIKKDWWNPLWIPITYDGSGNHICIDLDPTENGVKGQVIRMWHDDSERELISNSLTEWIKDYTLKIKNGDLVYWKEYESIVEKSEIE